MVNLSKTLTGLAVLVSVGCGAVTNLRYDPAQPATYAREDYGMGWDKAVALYNINLILEDSGICMGGGIVDEEKIWCAHKDYQGKFGGVLVDQTWEQIERTSMQLVEADGHCLYFGVGKYERSWSLFPRNIFCAKNARQAEQLKRAIEIYLRERKK